ncbi:sensor domain-containing phosphodiesterase [Herbiconiux liangxiaofengii]|uniref:sensor domain-containing phosphodiesterase n=1 Tax=Herbiconiux liangxiaofengii TaxID=3342795 RepID=UPI0035B80008
MPTTTDQLLGVLGVDRITPVFQPIVDIDSGALVASEALTRSRRGDVPVSPIDLFAEARRLGLTSELDTLCFFSAVDAAQAQGMTEANSLFVNIEPESLAAASHIEDADHPRVMVEVTERSLTSSPGDLLRTTGALRQLGHGIAIDDLGAEPASLALLPLIRPDVIKLDMALIRRNDPRHAARIMTVVAGYAERQDAVILAEGIETDKHLATARAMGATLGQGWLFGRPDEHFDSRAAGVLVGSADSRAVRPPDAGGGLTPFDIVSEAVVPRRGDRELLVNVSKHLEERAAEGRDTAVLLTTFQAEDNVTAQTRERYERLIASGCLLTVFTARRTAAFSAPSRNVVIADGDRLTTEWDVILLTADYAAALTAREIDVSRHRQGDYEFCLTTDRDLVSKAAVSLLTGRP